MAIFYINNYNIMNEEAFKKMTESINGWNIDMVTWTQSLAGSWIDLWMIQAMSAGMNIFQIVAFLLSAWWLYMISKKLWEKYSWLAFVPILQIYNYFAISKVSIAKTLVYPIITIIIWWILAMFTYWISLILAFIYFFIMIVKMYSAISTRCWRWNWTTLWFLFVPFIMFPIVWSKLENKSWNNSKMHDTKKEEKVEDTESTDDNIEY